MIDHSYCTFSFQIRGSVYNPGWQYDSKALEFAHHKEIFEGKKKTSLGTYQVCVISLVCVMSLVCFMSCVCIMSLVCVISLVSVMSLVCVMSLFYFMSLVCVMSRVCIMSLVCVISIVCVMSMDFEVSGVFVAQTQLEKNQKEEEDKLYKQFLEEREKMIKRLEDELRIEKEKNVKDLISDFEKISHKQDRTGLEKETAKLEQHYKRKREERLKHLIEKLTAEEKARVAKLIEKHSQEMLLMIAEKLTSVTEVSWHMFVHNRKCFLAQLHMCQLSPESVESVQNTAVVSRAPPVSPPEFRRSQLFKHPEEFENIDNQVFQVKIEDYFLFICGMTVVHNDYSAFTDLVKDLIQNCDTDLEKVRAIFRWITVKDLNKLEVDETVNPESPMGLLRGIKYGTESYHDLFKRLCSYAGIHCEVIQGFSKGAGYKPGVRMDGNQFRNSWTAVFLTGSWYFVNCNWGARHVKGHLKSQSMESSDFFYKCDEFYFITDPEDHIYQHYPDDPKWQLLECPISLLEFINLPVVKSPFYNYGLKFANHYDCTQYTSNGIVILQLKIPNIM
ncbi:hypothetical protein KUTeg_009928, partial [Tegillarca granosa]